MRIERKKLANKLESLWIDVPESGFGSVQIWFRAGSALEQKRDYGIAHFLEHMFFKGTKSRPGNTLTNEIESYGGEVNAFTSFDYTCYYINTPRKYLPNSIEILLDMVTNPEFKQKELVPERGVVFEEYRRSLDNSGQFAFKEIQKSCFTKGYAHPILGTESTIKSFSREQLLGFRKRYYNLSNCLLVVSGDLRNEKKLQSLAEKFHLPHGPQSTFQSFQLKDKETIQVHQKEVRMMQLNLIIQAPSFLEATASSEDLAINCLGHGETSRLYKDLVLKNTLANNCSASTMYFAEKGAHFVKFSCPPESISKVYKEIYSVLKDLKGEGFSDREVQKIKNQYMASKIYEKESVESLAFSLGHGFAQNGNIFCEDEFIERIKKTRPAAVNRSLQEILSKNIHFNLQIPLNESLKANKDGLREFQQMMCKLKDKDSITSKKYLLPSFPKSKVIKVANKGKNNLDPHLTILQVKEGIKLIHRQNTMSPTFILHAYLKGGLSEEDQHTNGIGNLVSNVITKGHDGIPFNKIKNSLEEKSASLSGFSGKNTYGIVMHGQTEHNEELFAEFFGTLTAPDFLPKSILHEKKLVLRTMEAQKEDPAKQCFKMANHSFFAGHPYSQESLGTAKSIRNFNQTVLKKFHQNKLKNSELLITYCGDLPLEQVSTLLSPYLDKLKSRRPSRPRLKDPVPVFGQDHFLPFEREQTHIFMGLPSFKMGDPREVYLKVLTTFLSGQSSDLFVEVRDRQGLCYVVHPAHFAGLEGSYWGIYIASGKDKTQRAIAAISDILQKIQRKGLGKGEFNRLKKMIEGQNLVNLQTNEDYANIYSIPELHGLGWDYFYRTNRIIQEMDHLEFNEFIFKFLAGKINTFIVGSK